ncbi:oxidative damage protection protein [Buchnera aphidicola]|nr:oxidative damage protection protein [Buchnera aphidicola]USS94106.1 oxidative damage protection protein [Buchnera aphidicola (Sipha maydis)]
MKRKIYCFFYKQKMQGLNFKLYPGKIGDKIYQKISQKAWNQWIKKQTILINEQKLNMLNKKDQKILEKKMIQFLFKNNTVKKYQKK